MRAGGLVAMTLVAACGTAAPYRYKFADRTRTDLREAGIQRLVAATRSHDAAALERMLHAPVGFGGMWFPDPACRQALAGAGTLAAPGVGAFARCLANVPLEPSPRGGMIPEVGTVVYAPGFEVEVQFAGTVQDPKIHWIGYVGRYGIRDPLPTISPAALEALREGTRSEFAEAARGELAELLVRDHIVGSWFKVCLDSNGAISGVHPRYATSLAAQDIFDAAIHTWTFRPFTVDGQAMPVCSMIKLAYGVDATTLVAAPLPFPLPPGHENAVFAKPGKLLEGNDFPHLNTLVTDDLRHRARLAGGKEFSVQYIACVDVRGSVDYVAIMRASESDLLDRQLIDEEREKRYEPLMHAGQPIAVCHDEIFSMVYDGR